jgi:phage terminase large subunit-like protein
MEDLILPDNEIIVPDRTLITPDMDLDERLNHVDYSYFHKDYKPSEFALRFIAFIKMVNGTMGEENKSPIIHYDMIDQLMVEWQNLFVSFRGSAKTTALHEYMILYLAVYGEIPKFGEVNVGIYVSDTMDNGVKSMRNQLQFRWENSDFLQKYVPEVWFGVPTDKDGKELLTKKERKTSFTDAKWEFVNADGKRLCFRGFGASTGVRGFKEYGERPTWCGFDDLMSDKNAESPTITRDIKNIVYKAARQALHPKKRMILWTGTPFNKSDPLYEAAGSKAWNTRTYPICEKFPCPREEFRGAWEDRFPYEFVEKEYYSLLESGEISSFNQELMLRITSDDDRLVRDSDVVWYTRDKVLRSRERYNFYITTDFATAEGSQNDYSVIAVWAYTNNKDWLLVDGLCKRQLMDKNIDDLFRFVSNYKPLSVGIEINGQQAGFIQWLKGEMLSRNTFFNLAGKGTVEGIRRTGKKINNFKLFVPTIKAKKMWLPEEMKDEPLLVEFMEELRFATNEDFKSKHDDVCDTASMLLEMNPFAPSAEAKPEYTESEDGSWAMFRDEEEDDLYTNSTVF